MKRLTWERHRCHVKGHLLRTGVLDRRCLVTTGLWSSTKAELAPGTSKNQQFDAALTTKVNLKLFFCKVRRIEDKMWHRGVNKWNRNWCVHYNLSHTVLYKCMFVDRQSLNLQFNVDVYEWGDRRRQVAHQTARVVCQSHVVQRWVAACLQRWWDNSVCQSSSSATSVDVSSLTPRCQYMSHSVSRNGKFRTLSCQGQSEELRQRNQKSSYKRLTWPGW